jgi:anthranilate synthase component 1
MFTPSLLEFLKMEEQGKLVPLRRRIPADLETPVSAFLKLKGEGAIFLLESVEQGIQVGRYSFIGLSPFATIKLENETIELKRGDTSQTVPVGDRDPLSFVRDELKRSPILDLDKTTGPLGGAVGYMSYDINRYFEKLPCPESDALGLPDYFFVFTSALVVFDHVKSEIEIISLPWKEQSEPAYESARTQIDRIYQALNSPLQLRNGSSGQSVIAGTDPTSNVTKDEFKEKVNRAKEHIISGDAFQIVISQRLRGETHAAPFQIYRALRILNPSPYMFYIDFGAFQLVGSSPEVLVKLENQTATVCPIAGTRPRGATTQEDDRLESELRANEKECAEHVMLVDLGRNDLGRVCRMGSITTASLMHVEKYSHVMHLVSRVTGMLRDGLDMFDLLRATFPAGTLTGAPKIRAMEIISDLEDDKRGPYGGAVGYFGRQGDMDMCITIRTIVMMGNRYCIQGGAGIVADSSPDAEYFETLNKIRALRQAVLIAEEGF